MERETLGEFEQTVLVTLARLDAPASGREVFDEVVARTGREASLAAVHITLRRLFAKGLLDSRTEQPSTGVRRPIRHYSVAPEGWQALRDSKRYWQRLWTGVSIPGATDA